MNQQLVLVFVLCFVVGLIRGSVTAIDSSKSLDPECVSKCWENSKYVSSCVEADGRECLCDDVEFQTFVLQCLYSQCPTTQFGSALHHALSHCSDLAINATEISPPLIRHQGLRKRQNKPMASVSAQPVGHYVSASAAVHSVARRSVAVSALASARPIRSVVRVPAKAKSTPVTLMSETATSSKPSCSAMTTEASVSLPANTS